MTSSAARRTRIKFCGMRRPRDVSVAMELGVDAIGFVCVPASPRCVDLQAVARIRRELPPFVTCVALLLDPAASEVEQVISTLHPDVLQFHGREPADFCRRFGQRYMKVIAVGAGMPSADLLASYHDAAALLLDGHPPGELGGQGLSFDWQGAGLQTGQPVVLAGGLSADNVAEAIKTLHPWAVDVSSGIESDPRVAPAVKDSGKMAAFVDAVRRADEPLIESGPPSNQA